MTESTDLKTAFLAGGAAGFAVDVSLFPLDTIKTRLQSEQGFWKAGGVRGIYAGIASTTVGSVPTAALFFCTYELTKGVLQKTQFGERYAPLTHMLGASLGEVTACLIRVPVEVVKQRAQTTSGASSYSVLKKTIVHEGFTGLFRGYLSTVLRDFPFSFLQFPIWEYLKNLWSQKQGRPVDPWQSAVCGAGAGGSAALITNPLDVAKTRIMLAKKGTELAKDSITFALKTVYRERGIVGLFAGAVPRTAMVSVGGAIFLGVYDKAKVALDSIWT